MKIQFYKILLFAFVTAFSCKAYAQSDSLNKILLTEKDDTLKVKMLYEYSGSLGDKDVVASIYYAKQGVRLASNINMPAFVCNGILHLSNLYRGQNHPDSAVVILLEGLNIAETNHLEDKLPSFYARLGENYRLLTNSKQAEYYDYKYLEKAKQGRNDCRFLTMLTHHSCSC